MLSLKDPTHTLSNCRDVAAVGGITLFVTSVWQCSDRVAVESLSTAQLLFQHNIIPVYVVKKFPACYGT